MFFENDELTQIATVARTHGLAGYLSLKIHQDYTNDIITENMPVFLLKEGIPVPFFTENVKDSGSYRVVKLRHLDSEKQASTFVECKVFILTENIEIEEVEEEDSEYEGFAVYDAKHGFIGNFTQFNMIPGNPVFETELDGKTIIIPFAEEFILDIDETRREIHISAPEGLIELYLNS